MKKQVWAVVQRNRIINYCSLSICLSFFSLHTPFCVNNKIVLMFNILLLPNNRRANPGIFNDERLGWIERSVG